MQGAPHESEPRPGSSGKGARPPPSGSGAQSSSGLRVAARTSQPTARRWGQTALPCKATWRKEAWCNKAAMRGGVAIAGDGWAKGPLPAVQDTPNASNSGAPRHKVLGPGLAPTA